MRRITHVTLAAALVALTFVFPGFTQAAYAGAPGTINGQVLTANENNTEYWSLQTGETGLAGVRVCATWTEYDGWTSSVSCAVTDANGNYSIVMPDEGGNTFDSYLWAPPLGGERVHVWVDPTTTPAGMSQVWAEGWGTNANSNDRNNAMWRGAAFKTIDDYNFAYAPNPKPSLHNPTEANPGSGTLDPYVSGRVFNDVTHTQGSGETYPTFVGSPVGQDTGVEGIKVTVTVLNTQSQTKTTLSTTTGPDGTYKIIFPNTVVPSGGITGQFQIYATIDYPRYWSGFDAPQFINPILLAAGSSPVAASMINVNFVTLSPKLTLTKTGPATFTEGKAADYTLTVSNTGPSADAAVVTDQLPPGMKFNSASGATCTATGTVAAGQTLTCVVPGVIATDGTKQFTINVTPVNAAASVTNVATIDPNGGGTPPAPSTCAVTPLPATCASTGPIPVTQFAATDDNPNGTVNTTYADNGVPTLTGGTGPFSYAVTTGSMPPGLTLDPVTGAVSGKPTTAGTYNYTVTVTDSLGNTATYTDTIVIVGPPAPKLSITKVAKGSFVVGSDATYEFTITNNGNLAATQAVFADNLPSGLTYVSATPDTTCTGAPNLVCTYAKPLAVGASVTITMTVKPTQSGTVNNYAVIDASGGSSPGNPDACKTTTPLPANCGAATDTNVAPEPSALSLAKAGPTGGFKEGVKADWTFTISNTGGAATKAVVNDTLPIGMDYVSAASTDGAVNCTKTGGSLGTGIQLQCTFTGSIAKSGSVKFTVKVTPTTATAASVTNYATIDPTGGTNPGNPDLCKTAPVPAGCANSGAVDVVEFKATETNPGGAVNVPYVDNTLPQITGGTGPFTFSATGLPTGLSMDPATGKIIGTPSAEGPFTATVTVTDANGITTTYTTTITIASALKITGDLPNGDVGTAYGPFTPTTSGGSGNPANWTYTAENLPPGVKIDPATGVLSGTPTAGGVYNVVITVSDSATGQSAELRDTVVILPIGPAIKAGADLPDGTVGVFYSSPQPTVVGAGPFKFTVDPTTLPPGTTMDPNTGVISGNPTTVGDYPVTITVTDANGKTTTIVDTIHIDPAPLTLAANGSLPDGTVGSPYVGPLPTASGGTDANKDGKVDYVYSATGLPPGLSIDPKTGQITGTPTKAGTYPVTVTVTDESGRTVSFTQTVVIELPPMAFTGGTNLPDGKVGTPYQSEAPKLTGGSGEFTFTSTTLPAGLTIDPKTGVISGTPTVPGTYTVTITVTDQQTGKTISFTDTVEIAGNPVQITSGADLPDGQVGDPYKSDPPVVTGGTGPYTFTVDPSTPLPGGVSIDPNTGVITGTPTTPGDYPVTVIVKDKTGATTSYTDTVTILPEDLKVTAGTDLPNGLVGDPYTGPKPTVTGGSGNYQFSAAGLPDGLKIDPATGIVTGTPTTEGTYTVTTTVTDTKTGQTITITDTVVIGVAPIKVTAGADLPDGTVGTLYPGVTPTVTGGTGPYTFTDNGTLPPGLTLDPNTGAVTGTPTKGGSYEVTITVTDSKGQTTTVNDVVVIKDLPLLISGNGTLPNGTEGVAYGPSNAPTVTGGWGGYTFTSTALPAGLTIDPKTGVISGTPASGTAGTYTVAITVTDAHGTTATFDNTFTIGVPAVVLDPPQLPDGTVGDPYTYTPTVTPAGSTCVFVGLPPGLTQLGTSCALSGTPEKAGDFPVTVTVKAPGGASTTVVDTVTIKPAPSAAMSATGDLPNGTTGSPYGPSIAPVVTGGAGGNTFTASGLPDGLTMDPKTGIVSGTPTTDGTYWVTVTVTDKDGKTTTFTDSVVIGAQLVPVISIGSGSDLPDGTVGSTYTSPAPTVSGGTGPYTFNPNGTLPPGLTMDPNTGAITGTPTTPGTYPVIVTVSDAKGNTTTYQDVVVINPNPVELTGGTVLPDGQTGTPYTGPTPTAEGGKGPYTWTADNLPPGLTVNPGTGQVTGTPTTPGSYDVTVKVCDAATPKSCATMTDTVVITPGPLKVTAGSDQPDGTAGTPYTGPKVEAIGGTGPYTCTATGLPAGLSMDPKTCVISGTPTTPGTSTITIVVTDNAGVKVQVTDTITIKPGATPTQAPTTAAAAPTPTTAPSATPAPLKVSAGSDQPDGVVGTPYTGVKVVVTGGTGPASCTATGLPAGLTMDPATCLITGTPTTAGSYPITITVTDSKGIKVSVTDTITIANAAVTISLPPGAVGTPYETKPPKVNIPGCRALAKAPCTITWSATGLPPGLSIDPKTGVISGVPTKEGTWDVKVTATASNGGAATVKVPIKIGSGNDAGTVVKGKAPKGKALPQTGNPVAPWLPMFATGLLLSGLVLLVGSRRRVAAVRH